MGCPCKSGLALRYALSLSLLAHLIFASIFNSFLPSTAAREFPGRPLQVVVQVVKGRYAEDFALVADKAAVEVPPNPALPSDRFERSLPTGLPKMRPESAVGRQEGGHKAGVTIEESGLLLDGIREYRLNLARAAQHFRSKPPLANESEMEGVVVLVVSSAAGVYWPQVSLSQSSGQATLDVRALEMLTQAVRVASLPDSLKGQQFGLSLPIHFSMKD